MQRKCTLENCSRPHDARGYCKAHYGRLVRGSPLSGPLRSDSFESKVEWRIDKSGECWEWTGTRDHDGYGRIQTGGKILRAHRVVYELYVGQIPESLVLDHLCRNHGCVNPEHLEPVTQRENILRGVSVSAINARKAHCIRGHEFSEENTYVSARGWRVCRECQTARRAAP